MKTAVRKKPVKPSKMISAYALLSRIAKLALDEPRRMAMALWMVKRSEVAAKMRTKVAANAIAYTQPYPACGIVGCIGGWTLELATVPAHGENEYEDARRVLGLTQAQAFRLFEDDSLIYAPDQQTKRHAQAVATHIQRFQQDHEAQLRRTRVVLK